MFLLSFTEILTYGILGLLVLIDCIIYSIAASLYSILMQLANAQLLSNDAYQAIADRIYIIVGIVALFIMTFSLLRAMVNPDKVGDSIVKSFKSLVTSVLLIILLPTIFRFAFSFQNAILKDGVIHNLMNFNINPNKSKSDYETMDEMCSTEKVSFNVTDENGNDVNYEATKDNEDDTLRTVSETDCQGNYILLSLFDAFFHPTSKKVDPKSGYFGFGMKWSDARKYIVKTGNFYVVGRFISNVTDIFDALSGRITYIFLISTVAGAFAAYVIFSFCLDVGIRTFKLAFYQIIAPIPIFLKMIPGKESYFNKWLSATVKAFLEIFVRILLIEFMIFMCNNIGSLISLAFSGNSQVEALGQAILILGLLSFIKQAPKLFKDALGIEGTGVKLNVKEKLPKASEVPVIGGALNRAEGALSGALGAGWTSMTNGGKFGAGAKYGFANGWQKGGNQFNSQRQELYSKIGGKGKAGWFGKQNFMEKWSDDVKNKYTDDYKDRILPGLVQDRRDKNSDWKSTYEEKYNDLKNEHIKKRDQMVIDKQKVESDKGVAIGNLMNQKNSAINAAVQNAENEIRALQAEQASDSKKLGASYYQQRIDKLKDDLANNRNQLAKEYDSKIASTRADYDKKIADLTNGINLEDKILAGTDNSKTRKEIKQINGKYKSVDVEYGLLDFEAMNEADSLLKDKDETFKKLSKTLSERVNEKELNSRKDNVDFQESVAIQEQAMRNLGFGSGATGNSSKNGSSSNNENKK